MIVVAHSINKNWPKNGNLMCIKSRLMGAHLDRKSYCGNFCHKDKGNRFSGMGCGHSTSRQLPLQLSAKYVIFQKNSEIPCMYEKLPRMKQKMISMMVKSGFLQLHRVLESQPSAMSPAFQFGSGHSKS